MTDAGLRPWSWPNQSGGGVATLYGCARGRTHLAGQHQSLGRGQLPPCPILATALFFLNYKLSPRNQKVTRRQCKVKNVGQNWPQIGTLRVKYVLVFLRSFRCSRMQSRAHRQRTSGSRRRQACAAGHLKTRPTARRSELAPHELVVVDRYNATMQGIRIFLVCSSQLHLAYSTTCREWFSQLGLWAKNWCAQGDLVVGTYGTLE